MLTLLHQRTADTLFALRGLRGIWRVQSWLARRTGSFPVGGVIHRHGMIWRLWYAKDHVSRALLYAGVYEPEVTQWVQECVHPGDVCVDIGANAGYFVCVMARQVGPTGHVHAFEPSPVFQERLRHHIALNGVERIVRVNPVGVSDQPGVLRLVQAGCNAAFTSDMMDGDPAQHRADDVPVTTLDAYAEDVRLSRLRFVKMDVEGFEERVIRGGLRIIAMCRPLIAFEYRHQVTPAIRRTVGEVAEPLAELGYTFRLEAWRQGRSLDQLKGALAAEEETVNVLAVPPGNAGSYVR